MITRTAKSPDWAELYMHHNVLDSITTLRAAITREVDMKPTSGLCSPGFFYYFYYLLFEAFHQQTEAQLVNEIVHKKNVENRYTKSISNNI